MTQKRIEFGRYIYNGVDRKDNNLGYTIDNCVPCCHRCNSMKSNLSYQNFIQHISNIYKTTMGLI